MAKPVFYRQDKASEKLRTVQRRQVPPTLRPIADMAGAGQHCIGRSGGYWYFVKVPVRRRAVRHG